MIQKAIQKFQSFLLNFFLFSIGKYVRLFKKPRIPRNLDGKVLIHVGCGEYNDVRYINVDTRPGLHIHSIRSVVDIDTIFPGNYADLIYACHVLEHIPYAKTHEVLRKLHHCLKHNGVLRLSVPNFATLVAMYLERKTVEDILSPLMGGQGYPDNFHYTAFDESYLRRLLFQTGFREVRQWEPATAPYYTFDDWASRKIVLYGKEWPISLNIEAVKSSSTTK